MCVSVCRWRDLLPHHLLPWQLNSQERKRRNEGRQTGEGGEENWMRNACLREGEERERGNGGNKRCTLTAEAHHSGCVCPAGWRTWSVIVVVQQEPGVQKSRFVLSYHERVGTDIKEIWASKLPRHAELTWPCRWNRTSKIISISLKRPFFNSFNEKYLL